MPPRRPLSYLLLALLALLPVAAFWYDRADEVVAFSSVCVLLVAGSLYLMFGGRERDGAPA